MTLEEYFRAQTVIVNGTSYPVVEHTVRVEVGAVVRFYIHPANSSGDTSDFEVHGNTLIHDPRITGGP